MTMPIYRARLIAALLVVALAAVLEATVHSEVGRIAVLLLSASVAATLGWFGATWRPPQSARTDHESGG